MTRTRVRARLAAAWAALWAADPKPAPLASLALRDCGPSGPGRPVRDHLPPYLSTAARQVCLTRLNHGEDLYGAPLAVGWDRALIELIQELADAIVYAVAAGMPEGLIRDLCACLDTALRHAHNPTPRADP